MADAYEVISWDGHPMGPGTSYLAMHDYRDTWSAAGELTTLTRRSTYPLVTSTSRPGRSFTLRVNLADAAISMATFRTNITNWFDPQDNADGLRYLVGYGVDGTTQVRIGCYVTSWELVTTATGYYVITLYAPHDQWEANAFVTSAPNPASVTNNGNAPCSPSLQLTTTLHVRFQQWQITGAGVGGGGLRQYPVKLAINDSELFPSYAWVYVNGEPAPYFVGNGGLSTSYLWVRVDTHSDGTTPTLVDVVYSLAVGVNPLAATMRTNGIAFADPTCTNTTIKWDSVAASSNDALPWCWRPAVIGATGGVSGGSYAITDESDPSLTITRYTDATVNADADSIVMSTGGVAAALLSHLQLVTTGHDAPTVTVTTVVPGTGSVNEQQTISLANASGGAFTLSFAGVAGGSVATTRPGRASPATNEIQTITLTDDPTGGTYTVTFGASTSAGIGYNVDNATLQSALEAMASIGVGNVLVGGGPLPNTPVTVEFQGTLAATNVAQMTINTSGLNTSTQTTAPIAWNAEAGVIQAALTQLPNFAGDAVRVTGGPLPGFNITVEFVGPLTHTNVPLLVGNAAGLTGAGARTFVKSMQAGSIRDTLEWSTTSDGTATPTVAPATDTVTLAIGTEFTTPTPQNGASVSIQQAGGTDWSLALTGTPAITRVANTTVDLYPGAITIGGDTLTFNTFMITSGQTFIVEGAYGWTITSSTPNARIYAHRDMLQVSDPERWVQLPPGSSAVSHTFPAGAVLTLFVRDGWQL